MHTFFISRINIKDLNKLAQVLSSRTSGKRWNYYKKVQLKVFLDWVTELITCLSMKICCGSFFFYFVKHHLICKPLQNVEHLVKCSEGDFVETFFIKKTIILSALCSVYLVPLILYIWFPPLEQWTMIRLVKDWSLKGRWTIF